MGIIQRKRTSRTTDAVTTITLNVKKPRNTILRDASLGQLKLATVKHQKTKSAVRQAEKIAVRKVLDKTLKD